MQDGSDIEVLRAVSGPLYARRRDQVLAGGQSFAEVLAQTRTQPDRRLEITAMFLVGWQQERARYEAFERALDGIDVAAESRKITGLGPAVREVLHAAREEHGEHLLPYCWERLVKLADGLPVWKRIACFGYLTELPTEASIEPMFWCVDEAIDPDVRDGAHQVLVALPHQGLKPRLLEGKSLHASRAFVYEDLLGRIKLANKKKA